MKGKYTASTVAKWFLYYNSEYEAEYGDDRISNLKLQKLLYYAQGCYLALKGRPLFDENILHWQHGPVVREIYDEYKINGSNPIDYCGNYHYGEINQEDEAILINVYDVFGKYTAGALRNMTHEEDPWKQTTSNQVISLESIRRYFEDNYLDK